MSTGTPKRRTSLLIGTVVVTTLALVIGWFLLSRASGAPINDAVHVGPPVGVDDSGGIRVGSNSTATVDFYYDYFSADSKRMDDTLVAAARQMQRAGFANINYHPVATLNGKNPQENFSTRSAGAAYCVAEHSPQAFGEFHERLFAAQPQDQNPGLGNDQLAQIAIDAGAPATIRPCISGDRYEAFVDEMTARAASSGREKTPELYVGGKPVPEYLRTVDGIHSLILLEAGLLPPERMPVDPQATTKQTATP